MEDFWWGLEPGMPVDAPPAAIMGLSHFQLPSLVAVLGFFTGGLIVSWLILPFLLS